MPQRLNYRLRAIHVIQGLTYIVLGFVSLLNLQMNQEWGPVLTFMQYFVIITAPLLGILYLRMPKFAYLLLGADELTVDRGWPLPGKKVALNQVDSAFVKGRIITMYMDNHSYVDVHLKNLRSRDQSDFIDYLYKHHIVPEDPYESLGS
ncbi:hypothetical protein [Salisediminibacterium beveridgei]|uniref:Uncharacterized protein n=1 Tax=Salisediminibacterium beveridgei TaxID=632773 RepID=A0A1D7QZ63_9BACI|nr:hypothetical protein [Salisediminibacterium beveridgei]AOM84301.1 hypothetical protein BBEV_2981 [Salisediminibacterium beveridgei]